MMSVVFEGNWNVVVEATRQANRILVDEGFYDRIRAHAAFDLTDVSPRDIAGLLEQCTARLTVRLYKTFNPFSGVLGHEDPRFPDFVFLNSRRLNRSVASIVGTIIHEAVHAVDALSPQDFGHGGNSSVGKDNTAPYWIGNLAISMVSGEPLAAVEHAPHDPDEGAAAVAAT